MRPSGCGSCASTKTRPTLSEFEVAEQDGLWSIPSKDDYPADAAQQMAEAATSLMDRKILGVASKNAGDHEQYGVIDPLSPKLEQGQKGVGTRVTMSDVNRQAAGRPDHRQSGEGCRRAAVRSRGGPRRRLRHRNRSDEALDEFRGLDRKGPAQAQFLGLAAGRRSRTTRPRCTSSCPTAARGLDFQ